MSDEPTNTQLYLGGVEQWEGIAGKLVSAPFNYEDTGEPAKVELLDLYMIYEGLKRIGVTEAAAFVRFGLLLAGEHVTPPLREYIDDLLITIETLPETDTNMDEARARASVIGVHKDERPKRNKRLDGLLGFTYAKLRDKELTHAEAAEFASLMLSQDIKPDAWRVRVDRWAALQGLPKVGQRKRTKM